MLSKNLVQIAGIADASEAEMIQQCGVKYLGFPLRLAVHGEDISDEQASRIIRSLQPPVYGVLITYLDSAREIAELSAACGARIVQLHGSIGLEELARLKESAPQLTIIKSLIVGLQTEAELEAMVQSFSPTVDGFITDTYDSKTGATGATGKTHDWRVSRRLVEISPRPVILAGGLNPENVRRAIQVVKPFGVDAHTGVEDDHGRKCREKVQRFVSEAEIGFGLK